MANARRKTVWNVLVSIGLAAALMPPEARAGARVADPAAVTPASDTRTPVEVDVIPTPRPRERVRLPLDATPAARERNRSYEVRVAGVAMRFETCGSSAVREPMDATPACVLPGEGSDAAFDPLRW
jgi:hypothetical protein